MGDTPEQLYEMHVSGGHRFVPPTDVCKVCGGGYSHPLHSDRPLKDNDRGDMRAAIEAHRRAEYHKRWPDDAVPMSVNGDDPFVDLGDEHDRALWSQLDTRAISGEFSAISRLRAASGRERGEGQTVWVLNADVVAVLDELDRLRQLDGTADMGAVVSDSRKLSDTGAVAFPQDPPADTVDVLAAAWLDAWDECHQRVGRSLAQAFGDRLSAAGLAVVHADVPHGSRAEQVERMTEVCDDGQRREWITEPLFRWAAPSVDGDER